MYPAVIMLSVPLAIFGALAGLALVNEGADLGLWDMRGTINIYSQIGMTILIGIAAPEASTLNTLWAAPS